MDRSLFNNLVEIHQFCYSIGMAIGNLNLKGKAVCAPLAGISNRPFRVLAIRGGAAMTYTEMISSEAIIRRQKRTFGMMAFQPEEQPLAIQLFGANPEVMLEAARIVTEECHPDLLDVNFGCPAKKVVAKNGGAAVLKDLGLTREIIEAVVAGAGSTPVSIKMRTGWDDQSPVYLEVGRIAQEAGAMAVCLHARSRAGGYAGKADWSAIRKLKDAVGITVIGNGDVASGEDAARMIEMTGCDMVMIGRAAIGNPLIFAQVNQYLDNGTMIDPPSLEEKVCLVVDHAGMMVEEYGESRGVMMMRKHLGLYVRGFVGASEMRNRLVQTKTLDEIRAIFSEYIALQTTREDDDSNEQ